MIITLMGQKGGVGKTTSAVHLAAFLAVRGRTLLVDGDPNRSATTWAARGPGLPFPIVSPEESHKARLYDHVVIDSMAQPAPGDVVDLGAACDLVILPSSPDALSLDVLFVTCDLLKRLGVNHFKALLTMCPPRPSKDAEEAAAMLEEAGVPLFRGRIQRRAAFSKAALAGVPVYDVSDARAANAWGEYASIGEELLA